MPTNLTGWVSELARAHTRQLAKVAMREGVTASDALDAVQEAFHTFLSLPQGRSLAGERDDAERLMSVLVRNAARNMRRRHHRSRPHDTVASTLIADDGPSVDQLIAMAEEHVALLGCVGQLAEIQRQVVTLRMLEELAPEHVARELELSPGHIAVVLHRAKQRLRECMA
jgi:RNA polymerase sigma-70 factor, ECF subfamily